MLVGPAGDGSEARVPRNGVRGAVDVSGLLRFWLLVDRDNEGVLDS